MERERNGEGKGDIPRFANRPNLLTLVFGYSGEEEDMVSFVLSRCMCWRVRDEMNSLVRFAVLSRPDFMYSTPYL